MLLALDPASSKTGWAKLGHGPTLHEWGLIRRPGGSKSAGWDAVHAMTDAVARLLADVDEVVMEGPCAHYDGSGGHASGRKAWTYAATVGAIYHAAMSAVPGGVTVKPAGWASSKAQARLRALALFPGGYDPTKDDKRDNDGADAICLGVKWLDEVRMRELREGAA